MITGKILLMKLVRFAFILFLIFSVAACRRDDEPEEIGSGGGTFAPILSQPQPVTLEQLADAPQAYLDQYVQLTGRYEPVRVLVCINETARPNPATWSISDGTLVAQVGGFDEQVNELLPAGLEVTVNGIWRFWEGRVGCGKQAEMTQVWYLDATTMVSPSPLVRLTLTPSGEVALEGSPPPLVEPTQPAGSATPTATVPNGTTVPETPPGPIGPPDTPPPSQTPTSSTVTPTPTASPALTATAPISLTSTPALTGTLVGGTPTEIPGGTATLTVTPGGPTPTNTPTVTPGGSTATNTPNAANIIVQGNINSQSLVVDTLTAGVGHQYNFQVNAGDVISISVVMVNNNNPSFELVDPDGDVVARQNNNPAGETEQLISFTISETGQYAVVIREEGGNAADYAMTLGKATDTFVLVFNGPLIFDQSDAAFIKDNHLHYWHFFGESGDEITVIIEPTGDANMAFRVRDPLLQFLDEDYTNGGGGGVVEEATFTLPATGLYTIDVEEWDFASGDYTITIIVE